MTFSVRAIARTASVFYLFDGSDAAMEAAWSKWALKGLCYLKKNNSMIWPSLELTAINDRLYDRDDMPCCEPSRPSHRHHRHLLFTTSSFVCLVLITSKLWVWFTVVRNGWLWLQYLLSTFILHQVQSCLLHLDMRFIVGAKKRIYTYRLMTFFFTGECCQMPRFQQEIQMISQSWHFYDAYRGDTVVHKVGHWRNLQHPDAANDHPPPGKTGCDHLIGDDVGWRGERFMNYNGCLDSSLNIG